MGIRVCQEMFPKGLNPTSKMPGFDMDGYLKKNLDILARCNSKDMTWLGIIYSSTLAVGTGKTTIAQQIGAYYTSEINRLYGVNNTWNLNNIYFRGRKLMDAAPTYPKYSVLVLDEGDDLTEHHMKALSRELKRFFNKFRQLNLFVIIIVPDLFNLPPTYAVQRSIFAIDVKFTGEFDRGNYSFFSFADKRELYNRGRKDKNYSAWHPTFHGRFLQGYTVDKEKYLAFKLADFMEQDAEEEKTEKKSRKDALGALCYWLNVIEGYTQQEISDGLNKIRYKLSRNSVTGWISQFVNDKNNTINTNLQMPKIEEITP